MTPLFNGLSRINEAALNALDDAAFLVLRKTGALPLAYLHFLSVAQLSVFERLNVAQQQLIRPRENLVSLDEIFASADSAFCGSIRPCSAQMRRGGEGAGPLSPAERAQNL